MKILLLGKNGQVGWELQRALAPLGELVALDRHGEAGLHGDLADPAALAATVRAVRPDVLVNAAAYTAVDRAEQERELAWTINAEAPGVLAREMAALDGWLVHYSTDYVFDGSGTMARAEDAEVGPLNEYGRSKLAGEREIASSGVRHLTLRTSWVYAARGGNFAKSMLRLAAERPQLRVVDDQIGAPTGADLIADVTALALLQARERDALAGCYHLSAAGEVSWCDYARHVIDTARALGKTLAVQEVLGIPSAEYPTPAPRPRNSRLDTSRLQAAFGLRLPHWRAGVTRMLNEILTN